MLLLSAVDKFEQNLYAVASQLLNGLAERCKHGLNILGNRYSVD